MTDGLYYHESKVYIPMALRQQCIEEMHDTPYSGHKGIAKSIAAISRTYWWPNMKAEITKFVTTCLKCQRNKASTQKPGGKLQPLQVPADRWSEVTMDFITGLPCTPKGHDAVMVMCDRLTKMVYFAPCTKECDAKDAALLFRKYVFVNHGMPEVIISDRDTRFTSRFWQELMNAIGTKQRLSTAFHPQTDGQTERVNRVLEEYLRHFINPSQTDWDEWLDLAQFAYNNSHHEAIGTTPFYINYGRHPRLPTGLGKNTRFPAVDEFITTIADIVNKAKERLEGARQRAKHYSDPKRKELAFKPGDEVLLSTRFIQLKVPGVNKLLPKYIGPFTVKNALSEVTYRLHLPDCMKCHDVFHLSLLRPFHKDDRYQPPPLPFEFNEEDGLWFEINCILKHRWVKRGKGKIIQYLVSFKGHGDEHNRWCDARDVTKPAKDEYHQQTNTPTTPPNQPTTPPRQRTATTTNRRPRQQNAAGRRRQVQQLVPPITHTSRTTSGRVVKHTPRFLRQFQ